MDAPSRGAGIADGVGAQGPGLGWAMRASALISWCGRRLVGAGPGPASNGSLGASLTRELSRRTAPLVAGIVLAVMSGAMALLVRIADEQDRAAIQSSRGLVEAMLSERRALMAKVIVDYASWDEAYQHLHPTVDLAWAFERDNLAGFLKSNFGFELVLVLGAGDEVRYAVADAALTSVDLRRFSGGLSGLLAAARSARPADGAETVPIVGQLLFDGQPAIVGAGLVVPGRFAALAGSPAPTTLLVLVDRLTPAELIRRAGRDLVDELRFAGPQELRPASLPLLAPDGTEIARAVWRQPLPGTVLLERLVPLLALAFTAAFGVTALILRRALTAARALAESENRFRDVSEAASDWIFETDAALRLTYLSERFLEMSGFGTAEALGERLGAYLELEPPADEGRDLAWALADGPPTATRALQCHYRTRHGSRRVCRVLVRPVLDAGGRVTGYRGTVCDITSEIEAQREAQRLSLHDPLTGLPNRILLIDRLAQGLRRVRRDGGRLAVLAFDLDRFKPINDLLGHAAGDAVLCETARRMQAELRGSDTVARLGGDEFVAIVHDADGLLDLDGLCRRLLTSLTRPIALPGGRAEVGLSIGVAWCPGHADDVDQLLSFADMALYAAKQAGRGRFRLFAPEMSERVSRRRSLEQELRRALDEQQFELDFQPRFDLADMSLVAAEALLRWRHPERGVVPPHEFIRLAEESGLILPIGAWALRQACRRAARLRGLKVSVNISPAELARGDLLRHLDRILGETGLEPDRLELEVTEGALLQDGPDPLATLAALKGKGIGLALDDFGAGHAALACLRNFPFDRVKLDPSFILGLEHDAPTLAMLRAVVGLARAMGFAVTAEGVETSGQLRILRAEGCDEVQGFYIGRPVAWAEIEQRLAGPRRSIAGAMA